MFRLPPVVVMLISLVVTMPWVQTRTVEDGPNQVNWASRIHDGKEVVTKLQFYFHDTFGGKNPSAIRVAQAATTDNSSTLFGAVVMLDDPLTVGPDPSSKLVGRAQGMYGSAGQTDLVIIMDINYGFIDGIYNGSSIIIVGRNWASHTVREMAVVGGTGVFRFARGYAIARTYFFDHTTGNSIIGYNVTVVT